MVPLSTAASSLGCMGGVAATPRAAGASVGGEAASIRPMAAKGASQARPAPDVVSILRNRRLRHDYEVAKTFEAGLVLAGSEVKSLRNGDVQWGDAHGRMDRQGELWLYGLHIGEYRNAGVFNHQPGQRRKLLLQRRELDHIAGALNAKGMSLVPEEILFRKGWAKIVVALAKGRPKGDKRAVLREKATRRDVEREMARRMKRG